MSLFFGFYSVFDMEIQKRKKQWKEWKKEIEGEQ